MNYLYVEQNRQDVITPRATRLFRLLSAKKAVLQMYDTLSDVAETNNDTKFDVCVTKETGEILIHFSFSLGKERSLFGTFQNFRCFKSVCTIYDKPSWGKETASRWLLPLD